MTNWYFRLNKRERKINEFIDNSGCSALRCRVRLLKCYLITINMPLCRTSFVFIFTGIFISYDFTILPTYCVEHQETDIVASGTEEIGPLDDVCFPDEGCFSMGTPWRTLRRPMPPPSSPNEIATAIYFVSRINLKETLISISPVIDTRMTSFNKDLPVYVITHGISGSMHDPWIRDIKNSLLRKVDASIFLVDWSLGARGNINYLQVASNTRVVGAQIQRLLQHVTTQYNVNPIDMHLIGFGVGAHVLSYAAKRIRNVGRLTALDPTSAAFEGPDRQIRLDPDDAELVEVVHTDARPVSPTPVAGGGMRAEYGDVDFYVNGGMNQPSCETPKILSNIKSLASFKSIPAEMFYKASKCSHERATLLYAEAITNTNCTFWGHPGKVAAPEPMSNSTDVISIKQPYMTPILENCNILSCLPMGFYAHEFPGRGAYYLPTNVRSPYCVYEPDVDAFMKKAVVKAAELMKKSLVPRDSVKPPDKNTVSFSNIKK